MKRLVNSAAMKLASRVVPKKSPAWATIGGRSLGGAKLQSRSRIDRIAPRIYNSFDVYPGSLAMQVAKWGNSLAIRIPAAVAEALKLRAGDEVEIHVEGAREFALRRKPSREDLLKRLRAMRGRLPADFVFDRDEANER
jgi:antitoxin MazE